MQATKINFLFFLLMGALCLHGCNKDTVDFTDLGNWVKYSDFEGVTRSGAVSFVVDEYAYPALFTSTLLFLAQVID